MQIRAYAPCIFGKPSSSNVLVAGGNRLKSSHHLGLGFCKFCFDNLQVPLK